jgi:hypothetical protein
MEASKSYYRPSFQRRLESSDSVLLKAKALDDQLRCCEALPAFAGMTA